jgi:hypothetical protein
MTAKRHVNSLPRKNLSPICVEKVPSGRVFMENLWLFYWSLAVVAEN